MTTPIPISQLFNFSIFQNIIQLLISLNLYQHAKNQAFSSFRSKDIIYLKILQSNWSKTFLTNILGTKIFKDFSKHTAININFHYSPN